MKSMKQEYKELSERRDRCMVDANWSMSREGAETSYRISELAKQLMVYSRCIENMKKMDDDAKREIYVIRKNDTDGELVNFSGDIAYYGIEDAKADVISDMDEILTIEQFLKSIEQ